LPTALIAEGLSAIVLAARKEQRLATVEPFGAVALTAIDLWHLGHHSAAANLWQAYVVCHTTGDQTLFPQASIAPPSEFEQLEEFVREELARDPHWVPAVKDSLWVGMLAELDARGK
jgi:hypothetical protein